jgi:hypothetical protein
LHSFPNRAVRKVSERHTPRDQAALLSSLPAFPCLVIYEAITHQVPLSGFNVKRKSLITITGELSQDEERYSLSYLPTPTTLGTQQKHQKAGPN